MRSHTASSRRGLYALSHGLVATHYRRRLTLAVLARTLCSSPRQIQRAYAQFGAGTFQEDLRSRRLAVAAALLYEQPAIAVADVARLVGYRHGAHFARAFRTRYGVSPAAFRERARRHRGAVAATDRRPARENGGNGACAEKRGGARAGAGPRS